jgi:hypothetical protein
MTQWRLDLLPDALRRDPIARTPEERAPWLRLALRMPLGDAGLFGHQHEEFVFTAGLGLAF